MDTEKNFNDWFSEIWKKTGGLIQPATAADILGVSNQAINSLISRKKIDTYRYDNKTFLAFKDIIFYKNIRDKKKSTEEINEKELQELVGLMKDTGTSKIDVILTSLKIIYKNARNAQKEAPKIIKEIIKNKGKLTLTDIKEAIDKMENKHTDIMEKQLLSNMRDQIDKTIEKDLSDQTAKNKASS